MENKKLEELIEYELRCAKRYRRFVSLILLSFNDSVWSPEEVINGKILRECDEIFVHENMMFILLSDTNSTGAQIALERVQESLNGEFETMDYNIVSYPVDGHSAKELLGKVSQHIVSNNGR